MKPDEPLSGLPYGELLQTLLPDFVLAVVFFTALCYAILGRRFEHHQRPAVAISTVIGISLAVGLVWWEQQHGYSIRDLGPFAVALAIIFLGLAVYKAFRLAGGTIAGTGIAIGVAILIAWLLQVEWPVAQEMIQTIAGAAIIIGLIAFLAHHRHHASPSVRYAPRPVKVKHDAGNLYDNQYVSQKLRRGFRELKKRSANLTEHPKDAENITLQLRRMLPAEGWLTQRMAQLREKAYRIRKGHVARIEQIRETFPRMSTEQRKQASKELIAQYQSLKLDVRLDRLDRTVAANEKRIRELTRSAQEYAGKYAHRHLYETFKKAERLQAHNAKLLQLIDHSEKKLADLAQKVAKQSGEVDGA